MIAVEYTVGDDLVAGSHQGAAFIALHDATCWMPASPCYRARSFRSQSYGEAFLRRSQGIIDHPDLAGLLERIALAVDKVGDDFLPFDKGGLFVISVAFYRGGYGVAALAAIWRRWRLL